MALAKFREDITDRFFEDNHYSFKHIEQNNNINTSFGKVTIFDCYYCSSKFTDNQLLQDHIFTKHRLSYYIKIDDIIAEDITTIKYIPSNFTFNNISLDNLNISVLQPDNILSDYSINPNSILEFTNIVKGQYTIKVTNSQKSYYIFVNEIPKFDSLDNDNFVFKYANEINVNQNIFKSNNWNVLWEDFAKGVQNIKQSLNQEYISGFYEYLYGLYLEDIKNENNFSIHYEIAFGKLRVFKTLMSITILRCLAFKMNWFNYLEESEPNSVFFKIYGFFHNSFHTIETMRTNSVFNTEQKEIKFSQGILIDKKHDLLISAIEQYIIGDFNKVETIIEQIDNLMTKTLVDKNFMDKLILLKARLYRQFERNDIAKDYYLEIEQHPDFIDESKDFLNKIVL